MLKKPDEIQGLKQAYHDAFRTVGWSVKLLVVGLVILAAAFALSKLWSFEKLKLPKRRLREKDATRKNDSRGART
jgi:hypothetical protein